MRTLEAFNRLKPNRAQLIGGSLILSAGMLALAAVPNTFTSGTTISAAQVNANFADADTRITALESQIANTVACPANAPTRFTDKGDGTICDRQTGLMWEKKTGTVGARVTCVEAQPCSDPHNVNNSYSWGTQPSEQTGTLYTQFLPQLNDTLAPMTASPRAASRGIATGVFKMLASCEAFFRRRIQAVPLIPGSLPVSPALRDRSFTGRRLRGRERLLTAGRYHFRMDLCFPVQAVLVMAAMHARFAAAGSA